MEITRENTIDIIKKAYEDGKLGFQRGATSCVYYDYSTDSCCAIGIAAKEYGFIDTKEKPLNNIVANFAYEGYDISALEDYLITDDRPNEIFQLSFDEALELQKLHDSVLEQYKNEIDFKEYLYSL